MARTMKPAYRRGRTVTPSPPPRKRRRTYNKVGRKIGTAVTRRFAPTATLNRALADRTFYSHNMTALPRGTGLNQRNRNLVNLKGFKINFNYAAGIVARHQYLNVCVVAPVFASITLPDNVTNVPEFFRGVTDDRGTDFDPTLIAGLGMYSRVINTDRYTVLTRRRYALNHATTSGDGPKDWVHGQMWLPINKQLRYDEDGTCNTPIYLCYWVSNAFSTTSDPVAPAQGLFGANVVGYFNNIV